MGSLAALVQIDAADRQLLAAVGERMTEGVRRSGEWVVCQAGCTQCCIGPFAISKLDARRLREGLQALAANDAERAEAVRSRAEAYLGLAAPVYPGDPVTGELRDESALPDSLDELPCPALDPETGWCDLYAARPITCRTFGPVTIAADRTLQACELCYDGATAEQMAECAVEADPQGLESALLDLLEAQGITGITIVAFALAAPARGE